MPSSSDLRPRLCVLDKGDNGYGFHLHGEKGKVGQFIRLVEPDSPSESSGLRAGDRLVFVNGENVENDSHQQVVSRIRATTARLEMIVVDVETDQLLRKHDLKCQKEFVAEGVPVPSSESESGESAEPGSPRESTPVPENHDGEELEKNEEILISQQQQVEEEEEKEEKKKSSVSSEKDMKDALRPRLCVIQKGPNGYGFNLHSEKSRPGQFIRAVDEDSPAEDAGLKARDRILQVNGMSVEGKQHSQVVAAIKAGGEQASLLVVDPDTDDYFKKCHVLPTEEHLTGPLPEPVANGEMEEKVNGKVEQKVEIKETKVSVSPSPSNASSNASLTTPPPEAAEPAVVSIPALNLSLQQVKERAHQKRSSKRAPTMDWSKKNELFSNL
ncbi:Na(+)/H(+) exchange regulatory cofactor NHE-RF1 isoform X2 [Denticeps clupeoides]|uniref:Na(+)/H(+) exchange regulatory cofactor NHE-RF n=1 Tax=Denticeps clupeoides TaxID=299321 RepID=A0AAY4APY9_9TELE|nr:Na(+)/H(+) exchange regulatory cofactor NHE-RF1-like isoform X2 [Denticeps clupeoides]